MAQLALFIPNVGLRFEAANALVADPVEATRVLMEREELASTAIGEDIAIPHGKIESATRLIGCVGRSSRGVQFDSLDGKPTHLFFVLVAPESSTGMHLKALARISRVFKDADFRARLMKAPTAADMFRTIEEEDAKY